MGVSLVTCTELRLEDEANHEAAFRFVVKGDPCATLTSAEGLRLYQRYARNVLTLRRDEGVGAREILAAATVFEAPCRSGQARIYAIDALRIEPELCGFTPNVQTMLLASAMTVLATGEADRDDGSPVCVIMAVDPRDVQTQVRLTEFGAVRVLRPPPRALEVLVQFRQWRSGPQGPQCWWITPQAVANAAKLVLGNLLSAPATRRDRTTERSRMLTVRNGIGWLETARPMLQTIIDDPASLGWTAPPSETPLPLAGGLRAADRPAAAGAADAG